MPQRSLGDSRAIEAGWFGPRVAGTFAFVGHHGLLTADEQLIPLCPTLADLLASGAAP